MRIPGECFYKMSNTIFSYGLTPIQFAVYSYLVSCTGQKEKCWPSMKKIAACCNCSENTARKAIAALEVKGFVVKRATYNTDSKGCSWQTNNTYYLQDMPELPKKDIPITRTEMAVEKNA